MTDPSYTNYASIRELHDAYKSGTISVREVVLSCLGRIAAIDRSENGLNSVLEINPDALFIAGRLDAELKNYDVLPPLFGIPVLLKDNISTHDKMVTSAGSAALADNFASRDAEVVSRLRSSGAVILGKANMTEFANYMSREGMPTGYSSRGGQVFSPFNRAKHPGGSSSGSGVAVAAGLCTVAVGTETAGSIISPSNRNGIVGVKPTLGLVSRHGIIPISHTHDTAGPMARSVYDAAVLLSVMAGYDANDAATHIAKDCKYTDYAAGLDANALSGARVGVNMSYDSEDFKPDETELAAFESLCRTLEAAGAKLVRGVEVAGSKEIVPIMRCEFKRGIDAYLTTSGSGAKARSLADIVAYNQAHAETALKYGQGLLTDCQNNTSGRLVEPDYLAALSAREAKIRELDALFDDNSLDVLLCIEFSNIAAFTGFPSMTIPIGQYNNEPPNSLLPLGAHWIARRFDEQRLLSIAYATEQKLGLCIRPEL